MDRENEDERLGGKIDEYAFNLRTTYVIESPNPCSEAGDYHPQIHFAIGGKKEFKGEILVCCDAIPMCVRSVLYDSCDGRVISWVPNLTDSWRQDYDVAREISPALVISRCSTNLFYFPTHAIRILSDQNLRQKTDRKGGSACDAMRSQSVAFAAILQLRTVT